MIITLSPDRLVPASGLFKSSEGELIRLSKGERTPPRGAYWRLIGLAPQGGYCSQDKSLIKDLLISN